MHAVERAIAKIAGRQDNVITGDQLRSVGLERGAIAHRVKVRTMQRLHTNVYLLGAAPPTPMARARAAALSYGTDAVVSHRSAACLYGLLQDTGGDVDVTVPGRCPRQKARNTAPPRRQLPTAGHPNDARPQRHLGGAHDLRPRRHRIRTRHRARLPGGPLPRHRHGQGPQSRTDPRADPKRVATDQSPHRQPDADALRSRAPTPQADQRRPAPNPANERPRPRLPGRRLLAGARLHRSSSTAGRPTATGSRSRTTASAIRSCSRPGYAFSASPIAS